MNASLLSTKLHIPTIRPGLVARPHLVDQIRRCHTCRFTLVSAPAGFGKTTLLTQLLEESDRPAAWLSLDERDNEPARFLSYFAAGLGQIDPHLGAEAQALLQSNLLQDLEPLLEEIINRIAAHPQAFFYILDDYHVITTPEIQALVLRLLENLPAQLHLIIASRSDPPWPLSRLRVRGEVLEIRAGEMRFSITEAGEFLNRVMALDLTPDQIAALEQRTEGWIAGLQMAALSVRHHSDKATFIRAFHGSNRFVMDFLLEEVLNQVPQETREFLLKTSILDRLTGPLCDAVAGTRSGHSLLAALEKQNLFLVPLDENRQWYRYHNLFGELLRNHLQVTRPDAVPGLHMRAADWYEENACFPDAVHHAVAANDLARILELTQEMAILQMKFDELKELLDWVDLQPVETIVRYPWLLVARTWVLLHTSRYEAVESGLVEIEDLLAANPLPEEPALRIKGHIAAIRAHLYELRASADTAIRQAENALELLPEEDARLRAFSAVHYANMLTWLGEFDRAIEVYAEAGKASIQAGEAQLAIMARSETAMVHMFTGRLHSAADQMRALRHYAEDLSDQSGRRPPAMGIFYRHMSYLRREQNRLDEAADYGREAIRICRQWGEKESLMMAHFARARVHFNCREYDRLDESFSEILKLAGQVSPKTLVHYKGWDACFRLLRGDPGPAETWVGQAGLAPDDEIIYGRHQYYQILARLLAHKGKSRQALKMYNALLAVTEGVGAGMFVIQYGLLRATMLLALHREEEMLTAVGNALQQARAGGFLRIILDEGERVKSLLQLAIQNGVEPEFAGSLLSTLVDELGIPASGREAPNELVEPLTPREMQVLGLLRTRLSVPDMGAELFVSVSTIRSHIKNIYAKLDAHSRHEAVSKAESLKLLE